MIIRIKNYRQKYNRYLLFKTNFKKLYNKFLLEHLFRLILINLQNFIGLEK